MKPDPMKLLERLAEQAQREPAPPVAVADAVMRFIAAHPQTRRASRSHESLRDQFWFATAAACVAIVMCWLAWPSWESPFESYALLWSPLAGTLP